MNKIFKKIFIIILIIMLLLAFSKSYSTLNIDNLSVVVAMGIDVSDKNNLKISFQFTNPSSVSESGTSEQSPSIIYTVDASSISSGINLINTYIGKSVNLSHCKVIAFSEELATRGISDEIYTLTNDTQIRPSTNIVISKTSARYYLEQSKPLFENLITKYYEVFSASSSYTGFTSNATIGDFFDSLICHSCEPYAILGGVTNNSTEYTGATNSENDSSTKSNSSSLSGQSTAENTGLAIFKDDVLVGELDSIETLCFSIIRNNVDGFLISVPNPNKSNSYIDLHLTPLTGPKVKVSISNGTPYITLDCRFTGRIYSMEDGADYLDSTMLDQISDSCNSYLETTITEYLYKTSKALNSDINGFGKIARKNFLTLNQFYDYNWSEKYKDSFFNVTVNSAIRSSSLLTES